MPTFPVNTPLVNSEHPTGRSRRVKHRSKNGYALQRLSAETIRQIATDNPVEKIVGADVPLRRAGAVLVGRCPFHEEKTPSLIVTPARQRFHCFGCGADGDVFGYVMAQGRALTMTKTV